MEYIKKLLKSKSVWSGILKIIGGIALLCTGEQDVQKTLIEIIPIVWGALDVLLRHYTTESIGAKKLS